MELLTLKTLTVSMLVGAAISTSVVPAAQTASVSSYEMVSDATALKAEANIDVAPTAKALVASKPETTLAKAPKAAFIARSKDSLDVWLDKLIQIESNGRTNIKILDTNGQYSYGCLQFQKPTFVAYGRRYGLVSGKEANLESLIMSCGLQKSIAKKMILDDANNWRNWYTSVAVKNLGLPPVDLALASQ